MRRKFAVGFVLGMAAAAVAMWMRSASNGLLPRMVLSEPAEETKATSSQAENSDVTEETVSSNVETQVTAETVTAVSEAEDGVSGDVAV